jgi:hypothetical protein
MIEPQSEQAGLSAVSKITRRLPLLKALLRMTGMPIAGYHSNTPGMRSEIHRP